MFYNNLNYKIRVWLLEEEDYSKAIGYGPYRSQRNGWTNKAWLFQSWKLWSFFFFFFSHKWEDQQKHQDFEEHRFQGKAKEKYGLSRRLLNLRKQSLSTRVHNNPISGGELLNKAFDGQWLTKEAQIFVNCIISAFLKSLLCINQWKPIKEIGVYSWLIKLTILKFGNQTRKKKNQKKVDFLSWMVFKLYKTMPLYSHGNFYYCTKDFCD